MMCPHFVPLAQPCRICAGSPAPVTVRKADGWRGLVWHVESLGLLIDTFATLAHAEDFVRNG